MAYGIIQLAKAVLPGLGTAAAEPASAVAAVPAEELGGQKVDIVLPEEGPAGFGPAGEIEELQDDGLQSEELPLAAEAPALSPATAARPDASPIASPLEEDETPPPDSLLDDAEEASVPAGAGAAQPAMRQAGGLEDLDVLPDLEGFSDSFVAPGYGAADGAPESGVATAPARLSSGRQSDTSGLDPAALAQAVRTILKRDTKG